MKTRLLVLVAIALLVSACGGDETPTPLGHSDTPTPPKIFDTPTSAATAVPPTAIPPTELPTSKPSPTTTVEPSPTYENIPPVISGVDDQVRLAGEVFSTLVLNDYVADEDHADEELVWSFSGNVDLDVQIADGVASVTPRDAAWCGSETLRFEVCDPSGLCDAVEVVFQVAEEEDVTITFIGNDGFLIAAGETKILIDAFFSHMDTHTDSPSDVNGMANAQPPFDGVDLILTTHAHDDHFDPALVGRYLVNNPQAIFVSTAETVRILRERYPHSGEIQDRLTSVKLARGESRQAVLNGIGLEMLNLPHNHIANLGFIITIGGFRLLHTGDLVIEDLDEAIAYLQGYQLSSRALNVAFVPYFLVTGQKYHRLLREGIQATQYIPMHFNPKYEQLRTVDPSVFPEAVVLSAEMRSWELSHAATRMPGPALGGSGNGAIAFVSGAGSGRMELYVMDADGGDPIALTHNRVDELSPAWSPDGKTIAYMSQRDGTWEICSLDLEEALAEPAGSEPCLTDNAVDDFHPTWSPDGKQIAFTSDRDGDHIYEVWTMAPDGGDQRLLTVDTTRDGALDWSPDGTQIAFESQRDGNREIYVMDADGTNQRRLTENDVQDYAPAWSPDGASIAFHSTVDGFFDVYVMDADGTNQRRLTRYHGNDWWPQWSPDGQQILFSAFDPDNDYWALHDVYVMNADGSGRQQLTDTSADEWYATWRPEPTLDQFGSLTITVVYDNVPADNRLRTEWGFAAWVEYGDRTLLFDTGGDGATLLGNMEKLGLDPGQIEMVVLSHSHGDHTAGLEALLDTGIEPTVYLPASFPLSFRQNVGRRANVVEVTGSLEIVPGIHTTGEMGRSIVEQALVLETSDGLVIVTGCAHPGIVEVVERAREIVARDVALVLGGFHLMDAGRSRVQNIIADLRRLGVKQAAPTHCTGEQAMAWFADDLGDDYIQAGVGRVMSFEVGEVTQSE